MTIKQIPALIVGRTSVDQALKKSKLLQIFKIPAGLAAFMIQHAHVSVLTT